MAKVDTNDEARGASKTRAVSQKIHQILRDRFGDEVVSLVDAVDPYTVINDVTRFSEVMKLLREHPDLAFDYLRSVSGVDYPEAKKLASVYHLYSYEKAHAHVVKFLCDREQPEVPTVEGLWPTATWYERENYDLLGIIYLGNHDLRRIMLPEDWVGHPLRKDYVESADYHGIGTTRASPLEAFKQMDEVRRKAREDRGEAPPEVRISPVKPPEGWVPPKKKGGAADEEESEE